MSILTAVGSAPLRLVDTSAERTMLARTLSTSLASTGRVVDVAGFLDHVARDGDRVFTETTVVPLAELEDWDARPTVATIAHHTGRFFSIQGIDVQRFTEADRPAEQWQQPVIVQPEVGILGILAKEIDGVLHFLLQNKAEPGNLNGIQVSPTVQATRSNFTRVHGGTATPYLEYFLDAIDPPGQRTIVDVRQSEHGSWFLRKRNRNVVVQVFDEVEVLPGYHWLTLRQVAELLRIDNLVNMETRSVLSCLPLQMPADSLSDPFSFRGAVARSFAPASGSVESRGALARWLTSTRTTGHLSLRPVPLPQVRHWRFGPDRIEHEDQRYFQVLGVRVRAGGREVRSWDQPMVAGGHGLVAFVVRRVEGTLLVLVQLRSEGGNLDGPEVAPTVQCNPDNYGATTAPPLLDEVLSAPADRVHFDAVHSDEGGRFYHTTNRHMVVELDDVEAPPGHRWLTAYQLVELAQHSNYLNVQARSLLVCLQSLVAGPGL